MLKLTIPMRPWVFKWLSLPGHNGRKSLTNANLMPYHVILSDRILSKIAERYSPSVTALWASNGQFIMLLPMKNIAISTMNQWLLTKTKEEMRLTGFLVLLRKIIIECVMRAIRTIGVQSLNQVWTQLMDRYESATSSYRSSSIKSNLEKRLCVTTRYWPRPGVVKRPAKSNDTNEKIYYYFLMENCGLQLLESLDTWKKWVSNKPLNNERLWDLQTTIYFLPG